MAQFSMPTDHPKLWTGNTDEPNNSKLVTTVWPERVKFDGELNLMV